MSDDKYSLSAMIDSIRLGLGTRGQKELPCMYFYDEVGSALFEAICVLPEYGVARAGERLLHEYSEELVRHLRRPVMVAELGSGSGKKARTILQAISRRQQAITYFPIEISPAALAQSRSELAGLASVKVVGLQRDYLEGLKEVSRQRPPNVYLLVLFLGGTIGNFNKKAAILFLQQVRRFMNPGDALLLATDLMKPEPLLFAAYDDPIGVTSAFNLNILARLNRELGADFALSNFKHEVRFNGEEQRVEMHLRSLKKQTVSIRKAGMEITFEEGETIWTESSHKYRIEEVAEMAAASGFRTEAEWIDPEWPFAQSLMNAV